MARRNAPLLAYLKAEQLTTQELNEILANAAEEAERLIPKLLEKNTTGSRVKASQLALVLREIRDMQKALWADIQPVIQEGMLNAAVAAAQGEDVLLNYLRREGQDTRPILEAFLGQARRGLARVLAKGANGIPLSRQVYRTRALTTDLVNKRVSVGILLGHGAQQIAKSVRDLISPRAKGGVSYAAMRLARTELNNAFHTTQIQRYQDEPWTLGMEWRLSGSHPTKDECDQYAKHDEGLGTGVFPRGKVPRKPHPNCLCFLTPTQLDEDEFIDGFMAGEYDDYLDGLPVDYQKAKEASETWQRAQSFANVRATSRGGIAGEGDVRDIVRQFGVTEEDARLMVKRANAATTAISRPPSPVRAPTRQAEPKPIPVRPIKPVVEVSPERMPEQTLPSSSRSELEGITPELQDHLIAINRTGNRKDEVARSLQEQAALVPHSMRLMGEVRTMTGSELRAFTTQHGKDALGGYIPAESRMVITPQVMSQEYERAFRREVSSGWLSKCGHDHNGLESFLAHECGHHVQKMMYLAGPSDTRQVWLTIAEAFGVPSPVFFDARSLDKWVAKHSARLRTEVSKYGANDHGELLAEIWAEYSTNSQPRPGIRRAAEAMRDLAERNSR